MDVLFIALRVVLITIAIAIVWYILGGITRRSDGSKRGLVEIIGVFIRRIVVAISAIAVVALTIVGFLFGGIYLIPRLSAQKAENKTVVLKQANTAPNLEPNATLASLAVPTAKAAEPPAIAPYPVKALEDRGIPNSPKFEVLARGKDVTIVFFSKEGKKTGQITRIMNDKLNTVLSIPEEDNSFAMIFPVHFDSDCQYQTKGSKGKFVACKRDGPDKFRSESWGVRYAYFDSE